MYQRNIMDNRYYKGNLPQSEMAQIYKIIVGFPSQQFVYDKGKKIIIKLKNGDTEHHSCLNSFTEITKREAQILVAENTPYE